MLDVLVAQSYAAQKMPYMAPITLRLRIEFSDKIPTFATRRDLVTYVNPKYVESCRSEYGGNRQLLVEHLVDCWIHEALHVFLDYWGRQDWRSGECWNVAHDLEISRYVLPKGGLHPSHFKLPEGQLGEWYYGKQPEQKVKGFVCCSNHEVGDEKTESGGEGAARAAVIECAGEIVSGRAAGVAEGVLQRALEVLGKGRRSATIAKIQGSLLVRGAHDYSFGKLSRRQGVAGNVVLPAMIHRQPKCEAVLDVSGSMDGKVEPATDAILSIVRSVGAMVNVTAWDTIPQSVANVRSARDLEKLRFSGGGTDMARGIRHVAKARPDVVFVVTDGETPWPEQSEMAKLPRVMVVGVGSNWRKPPRYLEWVEV